MGHCRAEVVDGEVRVGAPSVAGGQGGAAGEGGTPAAVLEDFEVPSQLRQQFIEVGLAISTTLTSVTL